MAAKALEGSLEGAPNPTAYAAIITAAHDFCVSTLTQYGAVHHGHLGPPIALCALHRLQPPRQGKVHSHLMTAPHNQSWPTYITPHAMDAKSAAEHDRLRDAIRVEIIRVANSARVDVSMVMGECLAVRAECAAEANRGRPVARGEVHRRTLERLAAFESELITAAAPDGHMVTEWGPQMQGQAHPGPEGAS